MNHLKGLVAMLAILAASSPLASGGLGPEKGRLVTPLKERLHALFSGHGATHMKTDEVERILQRASENPDDVLSLLDHAETENYLVKLTNYVRLSNLDDETKSKFYRDSYELCKRHLDQGELE